MCLGRSFMILLKLTIRKTITYKSWTFSVKIGTMLTKFLLLKESCKFFYTLFHLFVLHLSSILHIFFGRTVFEIFVLIILPLWQTSPALPYHPSSHQFGDLDYNALNKISFWLEQRNRCAMSFTCKTLWMRELWNIRVFRLEREW